MYEFLEQNSIYVVMLIVLMIWAGLFAYLVRIDRKIKELE
jgi:CcmD family protein